MNKEKIKYFLYARKSSEDETRQIQSIDDQISRLKDIAKNKKLHIVEIFQESKSAKKPNNRPAFSEMVKRIKAGEAKGILCWNMNRLCRNPIDGGTVTWLLQNGIIQSIYTPAHEFLPTDNVIMVGFETNKANQYIIDLRNDVIRGTTRKAERGWSPNLAPLGYLNRRDEITNESIIVKDPVRFPLIRQMWDLMLTGSCTPPQILEKANKIWGFRTRKTRKTGDKELSKSSIYRIFTSIYYTGDFMYFGKQYKGKHEPMVTLEEFDRVQILLGRKGKPRPKTHTFAFTGLIRCSECGCVYTAEEKKKLIKSTGKIKYYTYYHCTRRKKEIDCTQRKSIKEEALEKQIEEFLGNYTILPEFRDWAMAVLNEQNDQEIETRSQIHTMQSNSILKTQKELDRLTQMRYRDLIDDDEYLRQKEKLQVKIAELKKQLRVTETRAEKWLELTEQTFDFATHARKAFVEGDMQTKREIIVALGKNPIISDGQLNIEVNEWLQPIGEKYPELEKEYLERLEPVKIGVNQSKTGSLETVRIKWLADRESNPDCLNQNQVSYR